MANYEYLLTLLIVLLISMVIQYYYKIDLFKGKQWEGDEVKNLFRRIIRVAKIKKVPIPNGFEGL